MSQTHAGAMLAGSRRAGISLEEFKQLVESGKKWCWKCRLWKTVESFGKDASRADGLASACCDCRKVIYEKTYVHRPRQRVVGRRFSEPRDGDHEQARGRANYLSNAGLLPKPNSIPCVDCGHVWEEGERRHEFDHFEGYAGDKHDVVEVVCTTCHAKRDSKRAKQTHCKHGHEFTEMNTIRAKNGTRHCRECRRLCDKNRGRDAAFWRNYRLKRKGV